MAFCLRRPCAHALIIGAFSCANVGCALADLSGLDSAPLSASGSTSTSTSTTGGGGTTCSDVNALLCDDFEAAALKPVWIPNTQNGGIEIDSIHVHSGQRALHLGMNDFMPTTDMNTDFVQAFVAESQTLPATPDASFARAYVFVPHLMNYPANLLGYAQSGGDFRGITLQLMPDGTLQLVSSITALPGVPEALTEKPDLGKWVCMEWEVDFQSPQQVRIWLNGTELSDFNRLQTTAPADGKLAFFQLGPLVYFPPSEVQPFDMWVDDVVVDTKQIGCN